MVFVEGIVADFSLVSNARPFADLPVPSTSTNDSKWPGFCVMEAEVDKTCTMCGETKPVGEFHKNKRTRDGHRSACKACRRVRGREWYKTNQERETARSRAWYEANQERAVAASKAWYEANQERAATASKAWHEANKDRVAITSKAWHEANKDRTAAVGKAWREANKDRKAATTKVWSEANPERVMHSGLQSKYGISLVDYDEMLEAQGRGCAICGKTPEAEGRQLAVDHDHETDEIRGLLCSRCNPGLGMFMDDPELLRSAIAYLERWIEREMQCVQVNLPICTASMRVHG